MMLLDELRGSSRLRIGLAVIAAIFCAYGLLEWRDQGRERLAAYEQLVGQLARLSNHQTQAEWPSRAQEAGVVLEQARQGLWHNSTIGLAQAEFQDWLQGMLREAGVKNANLRLTDVDALVPTDRTLDSASGQAPVGFKQLRARLDFNAESPVILALLAAMNDSERQVVIETLIVKAQRVDLVLSAWVELRQTAAEASGTVAPPVEPFR